MRRIEIESGDGQGRESEVLLSPSDITNRKREILLPKDSFVSLPMRVSLDTVEERRRQRSVLVLEVFVRIVRSNSSTTREMFDNPCPWS